MCTLFQLSVVPTNRMSFSPPVDNVVPTGLLYKKRGEYNDFVIYCCVTCSNFIFIIVLRTYTRSQFTSQKYLTHAHLILFISNLELTEESRNTKNVLQKFKYWITLIKCVELTRHLHDPLLLVLHQKSEL